MATTVMVGERKVWCGAVWNERSSSERTASRPRYSVARSLRVDSRLQTHQHTQKPIDARACHTPTPSLLFLLPQASDFLGLRVPSR